MVSSKLKLSVAMTPVHGSCWYVNSESFLRKYNNANIPDASEQYNVGFAPGAGLIPSAAHSPKFLELIVHPKAPICFIHTEPLLLILFGNALTRICYSYHHLNKANVNHLYHQFHLSVPFCKFTGCWCTSTWSTSLSLLLCHSNSSLVFCVHSQKWWSYVPEDRMKWMCCSHSYYYCIIGIIVIAVNMIDQQHGTSISIVAGREKLFAMLAPS